MKIIYLLLLLISCDLDFMSVEEKKEKEEVTRLEDAKTYEDTIYVIDQWNYTEDGYRKPPCSMSPYYQGCMENRIKNLGLDIELR